ncbi:uncharacterized protein LOC143343333 isoform X2 [Colletes latitarsis]|uniref:uncharacterized protein LOC143343333 isoform X2 n=1 Tax=Colletes latitarsis TaxID=2605962 RepID=UPI004036503D
MATDIEKSDIEESNAPPKRQCTQFVKVNETFRDTERSSSIKEDTVQYTDNIEYDDVEIHVRDRLKSWQECQLAKGHADNYINKLLEIYTLGEPPYSLEESSFQFFRTNDMEDTAIMMAIENHGLIGSAELVCHSSALSSDNAPESWTGIHCSCPPTHVEGFINTSANSLRLSNLNDVDGYNGLDLDLDKIDESDQQENFLERAVAEAIKKKGLTAPNVDYS